MTFKRLVSWQWSWALRLPTIKSNIREIVLLCTICAVGHNIRTAECLFLNILEILRVCVVDRRKWAGIFDVITNPEREASSFKARESPSVRMFVTEDRGQTVTLPVIYWSTPWTRKDGYNINRITKVKCRFHQQKKHSKLRGNLGQDFFEMTREMSFTVHKANFQNSVYSLTHIHHADSSGKLNHHPQATDSDVMNDTNDRRRCCHLTSVCSTTKKMKIYSWNCITTSPFDR